MIDFENFLNNLSKRFEEWVNPTLTAEDAWEITKSGMISEACRVENEAKAKIKDIDMIIRAKSHIKNETVVIMSVPDDEKDIYDIVIEHYKKNGYFVATKTFKEEEIPGSYLIISWLNGNGKDKNTKK